MHLKIANFAVPALTAAFCVGLFGYTLYAGVSPLQFNNETIRQATSRRILSDKHTVISQLEDVVTKTANDPKKAESTKSAMILLGKLRADEAAPLLVDHLTFTMPSLPYQKEARLGFLIDKRPAVGALSDIGLAALPPLLARRMNTDDRDVNAMTFSVMLKMLDTPVARAYVQQAIDSQSDAVKRKRLIELRDDIANVIPKR